MNTSVTQMEFQMIVMMAGPQMSEKTLRGYHQKQMMETMARTGIDSMRNLKIICLREDLNSKNLFMTNCKFSFIFRYAHQKTGVSWLYNLFLKKQGGILADDMGLGKTAQISTYLKGLFESMKIKKAIIICPTTLKQYWKDELSVWCPKIPV